MRREGSFHLFILCYIQRKTNLWQSNWPFTGWWIPKCWVASFWWEGNADESVSTNGTCQGSNVSETNVLYEPPDKTDEYAFMAATGKQIQISEPCTEWKGYIWGRPWKYTTSRLKGGKIRKRSLASSVSMSEYTLYYGAGLPLSLSLLFPQSLAWPHACLKILSHIITASCNVHPMKCCCLYLHTYSDLWFYFPLDFLFFRTHINRITEFFTGNCIQPEWWVIVSHTELGPCAHVSSDLTLQLCNLIANTDSEALLPASFHAWRMTLKS